MIRKRRNRRTGLSIRSLTALLLPAGALVYLVIWSQTGELFSPQVEIRKAALDLEQVALAELRARIRIESETAVQRPPGNEGFAFSFRLGGSGNRVDGSGEPEILEPAPAARKKVRPLPGTPAENQRYRAFMDELEQREFIRNDIPGAEEVLARLVEDQSFRTPDFRARVVLARAAFLKRRDKFDEAVPELYELMRSSDLAAAPAEDEFSFALKALLLLNEADLPEAARTDTPRERVVRAMARGRLPLNVTELRAVAEDLTLPGDAQRADLLKRAGGLEATELLEENREVMEGMARLPSFALVALGRFWTGRTQDGVVTGCVFPVKEGLNRLLNPLDLVEGEGGLALHFVEEGSPVPGDVIRSFGSPAGIEGATLHVLLADRAVFERSVKSRRTFILGAALFLFLAMGVLGFATVRAVRREVAAAQARSDFMAAVSHELRTPLASIRMFAELLEEGRVKEPDTRQRFMRLISSNCRRLSAMIENVLDLSRSEQGLTRFQVEEVDLGKLLEDLFRDIRAFAEEEGFTVDVEIADDLPAVQADPMALARAVFNLCDNARKYSGEERLILVKAEKQGDGVRISIRDFGPGIAETEWEKVFQRFQRGDEGRAVPAGVGLGLSLAREAVEGCGGRLELQSRMGDGSTFFIHLPGLESGDGDIRD